MESFFYVFGCFENPDEARSPRSVQLVYDVSKGLNLITISTETERPRQQSVFVVFALFISACAPQLLVGRVIWYNPSLIC